MTDITMCEGKDCNMTSTCYRYLATACKYYQAYFSDAPHKGKDKDNNTICEHYWEVDKLKGEKDRGISLNKS